MLIAAAILFALAAGIIAYRWRQRRVRDQVADAARKAGFAMLRQQAWKQSSIELRAKLGSGVLLGASKEAAKQILRERGES